MTIDMTTQDECHIDFFLCLVYNIIIKDKGGHYE